MTNQEDDFELVRGSGNVFADFDAPYASLRQLRATLAAEIVKALDAERLTVRDAEARTGIAAADFSRIRQVKVDRFTIDRLLRILDRLNRDVWVKVSVATKGRPSSLAAPLACRRAKEIASDSDRAPRLELNRTKTEQIVPSVPNGSQIGSQPASAESTNRPVMKGKT